MLSIQTIISTRPNRWIISGRDKPTFLAVSEQSLKKDVLIKSTDWIHDYAPKLGLGEYFIVEIPIDRKEIKDAWSLIEEAEEAFRRWDIGSVYNKCRKVGYELDRVIMSKFGKDSFNYKERWGRAYAKFEHLASLEQHLEEIKAKSKQYKPKEIKVSKADAEHLLIITKALIKFAEELLREAD